MGTPEALGRRALRAYELGRLRGAARAAWVLVPLSAVCALGTGAADRCACLGFLLLAAAVFLRWRHRRGVDSVRDGVLAGLPPLLGGLAVARPPGSFRALAFWVAALAGLAAGAWLGSRRAGTGSVWRTIHATGVAVLVASLGCVGLGELGVGGAAAGLALGTCGGAILRAVLDRGRRG